MLYLRPDQITIGARQRKKIESAPLADLQEAIRQRGLLHPPTFRKLPGESGDVFQLVVGERRTKVLTNLITAGIPFTFQGETVTPGVFPAFLVGDGMSRADLKQVEYDENKLREALTWQDDAEALAEIHRLRQMENPGQTRLDTAHELVENNIALAGASPAYVAQEIFKATAIAERLSDPTIAKARNKTEAYNLILKKEEEAINASLAKRRLAATAELPSIRLIRGDCMEVMASTESSIADLILSDPPFGIGADSGGFRQRTVHHHNYEDTPENAAAIAQSIIFDGFRIAKPQANLWLFCDIDLFPRLKEMCGRVGWVPFRTPIIWQKSLSEGMAPWQGKGPRRTYEVILYATKGQRGLITSPVDILTFPRVPDNLRTHAAEKPVDLLKRIIECSTLPGDFVFDPCCGSGSTLVAARETKRTGLGIELDEGFYNTAMSRVYANPSDTNKGSEIRGGTGVDTLA